VFDRGTVRRAVLGSAAAGAMWAVAYFTEPVLTAIPAYIAGLLTFVGAAAAVRLFSREEIALIGSGLEKVARKFSGLRRLRPA
jgi:hypothetical protein